MGLMGEPLYLLVHSRNLDLEAVEIEPRRGKTGGSGRVRVGSIGFAGQTGHGSKRVIFKRVNRVTGQSGFGSG